MNDKIGAASALMNETDLLIKLVLVTPDDRDHEVWAAATSGEEAISRVLAAATTPRSWDPPTAIGLSPSSGLSRCSTDA